MKGIIKQIELLKIQHYYCEDTWYSCPKHPDGCADGSLKEECNCGADDHNDKVDEIIGALLDAPEITASNSK